MRALINYRWPTTGGNQSEIDVRPRGIPFNSTRSSDYFSSFVRASARPLSLRPLSPVIPRVDEKKAKRDALCLSRPRRQPAFHRSLDPCLFPTQFDPRHELANFELRISDGALNPRNAVARRPSRSSWKLPNHARPRAAESSGGFRNFAKSCTRHRLARAEA